MSNIQQGVAKDLIDLAKTAIENNPAPTMPEPDGLPWYQIFAIIATPFAVVSASLLAWFKLFKKNKKKESHTDDQKT